MKKKNNVGFFLQLYNKTKNDQSFFLLDYLGSSQLLNDPVLIFICASGSGQTATVFSSIISDLFTYCLYPSVRYEFIGSNSNRCLCQ
jgi:hypothetical protein